MFTRLCRAWFNWQKWSVVAPPSQDIKRCVMIGAPHTSNWDFIYAMGAYRQLGLVNPRFTIKKEWMRFPFNLLLGPLGAIAIDRSKKQQGEQRPNMVEQMAKIIAVSDEVTVLVTPEGTRSAVTRWRSGFYHIALRAEVPILLGYLDYRKREAGIGKVIYPSGDFERDMREIHDFYNTVSPKHPERHSAL
ncbi:MAG: 1-acyl-sn-glycerol-3-phosphate acyltransferase [Pseudomonadales bacterium]